MYERATDRVKAPDEILTARIATRAYDERMSADAGNGDGRAYGLPAGTIDHDLTSVDAGTPGGELLRRYWHPVALSEEATDLPRARSASSVKTSSCSATAVATPGSSTRAVCTAARRSSSAGSKTSASAAATTAGSSTREGRCLDQPCEPEHGLHRDRYRQPWYPVAGALRHGLRVPRACRQATGPPPLRHLRGPGCRVSVWWPTAQASGQADRR